MFHYKKPFSNIFIEVSNYLYTEDNCPPYILHFQAYDLENNNKFLVRKNFLSSPNYTPLQKEQFDKTFSKSQQLYHVLLKFYQNLSCKKAVGFPVNHDLSMEPLYMLNNKQKFRMLHENTNYIFSVKDLIKIIQTDLLNHDQFFPEPITPKNPFNNIPFTSCNIYNFYFYLKEHNYFIPEIITAYFRSNLNKQHFIRNNEILIRTETVKNYDKQLTSDDLYEEAILLLRSFKITSLFIHIDFPRQLVIEKTQKLLKEYWHSEYELTERCRKYHRSRMFVELDNFLKNNQNFGRIIFKRGEKKELKHGDYKIKNLMSLQIPDYNNLNNIIRFMKDGKAILRNYDVFINLHDEEDEDHTQDEFESDYEELPEFLRRRGDSPRPPNQTSSPIPAPPPNPASLPQRIYNARDYEPVTPEPVTPEPVTPEPVTPEPDAEPDGHAVSDLVPTSFDDEEDEQYMEIDSAEEEDEEYEEYD